MSAPSSARPNGRVGVREVARAAGVSTQTVSRVINDHPGIRPETRQRVQQAMTALDYRVNNAARALGTSRTRTIGILASDASMYGPAVGILALEAAARVATVALAEAEAVVDRALAEARSQRDAAVASTGPDALAQYQRLRPAFGGSAVVRLVGTRCQGCPLAMPAMEVDRIRKSPPGLATCDECGRLVLH